MQPPRRVDRRRPHAGEAKPAGMPIRRWPDGSYRIHDLFLGLSAQADESDPSGLKLADRALRMFSWPRVRPWMPCPTCWPAGTVRGR